MRYSEKAGGMIHVCLHYKTEEKKCFIEIPASWRFGLDHEGVWRKKVLLERALAQKLKIIECSYCRKPAIRLDHLWPYHSEMNSCREHMEAWETA